MDNIQVKTLQELLEIEVPQTGSLYYCEENSQEYVYNPHTNEWEELSSIDFNDNNEEQIDGINLYQVNKMLMKQMPIMSNEKLKDKGGKTIEQFYCYAHKYYMLLCKDYNYYTVFEHKSGCGESFVHAVLDIIKSLGNIYSIEINDDGILEIWIAPNDDENQEIYAFFLFPYDNGVVNFE